MSNEGEHSNRDKVCTGTEGLDDVLCGGFPANRLYLMQGDPGVGKTTLSLQFLLEGARRGEPVLYVTLSETVEEIQAIANAHGWDLSGVTIYEMSSDGDEGDEQENTLYVPDEVELGERMAALLEEAKRVTPKRIVIDSCSELRLLARSSLRFRRQILALKSDLVARRCTTLLLDNPLNGDGDVLLQSLVHGVITLEQLAPLYGAERRRLRVVKMRGMRYRGGFHDFVIKRGGVQVFPRLVAAEHGDSNKPRQLSSDIPHLDELLGGGLDSGTCTLLMGPAGAGKSVLATSYCYAALQRGERVAMFNFDESTSTLLVRSTSLGMDLQPYMRDESAVIQQVDPAEMSPGELVYTVRTVVEKQHAKLVVIDSLNGYFRSLPEENFLLLQLHELLSYLRHRGVAVILVVAQHGLLGASMTSSVDVSYVSDTVILLRYFEAGGTVRKAVSVLKKRTGAHETSIRELSFDANGINVGPVLADFHGVLSGIPSQQPQAAEPRDPLNDRALEERMLILAPTGRDAALTATLLRKGGLFAHICRDLPALFAEVARGAACMLVAEEVITAAAAQQIGAFLEDQEAWSDLPFVVFMGTSSDTRVHPGTVERLRGLGNVTLLDRPLRPIAMVSAVRAALRARRRQYEARDELVRRQGEVQKRDQFLAMLSHELRNPLSAMMLAADTLEDPRPEQSRRLEIIQRQCRHLTRLIDDLLDVARVTIGKIVLREETVELNDLADRVVHAHEQTAAAAHVRMSLSRAPGRLYVRGDAVRLEQVLGNLITNGIKYTPAGGHVDVVLEGDAQLAWIRVRDDGVGIAPEVLPQVFDLFAQADSSLDRSRGGLGIGLTVARSLIGLHGGRVDVHSAGIDRGSEFVMSLPRVEASVSAPESAAAPAAPVTERHRVLVVEDNIDSRDLMHMVLESYGHEVAVAGDGEEGVRCAHEVRPNVALVDIGLPGLDGFEVARHLRADLGDDIVLIALSGYGREEDRRRSKLAGFDLHYLKPIDSARLRRLLATGPAELARRRKAGELSARESES